MSVGISQLLQWSSIGLALLAAMFAFRSTRVPLHAAPSHPEPFVEELKNLQARVEQQTNFAAVQSAFRTQSRMNALSAVCALASAAFQVVQIFL